MNLMIDMGKYYLGIDIGTSSVKLVAAAPDGDTYKARCAQPTLSAECWLGALKTALCDLGEKISLREISAISLSSQVGTYITDNGDVVPWVSSAGESELREIKSGISEDGFIKEIGMAHPDLISYPLPRLLYIKRNYKNVKSVIMPKEAVIQALTGRLCTDTFSQRGICNPTVNSYSEKLLNKFDIDVNLPPILYPTDMAGYVTKEAATIYGLPAGLPVCVGCNDFYAGLLGMGVYKENTVFELSGTSEHIGVITDELIMGKNISGRYFNGYATYGGTKASGVSCDFAIENFGIDGLNEAVEPCDQPIFLPYLKGERAPIYNEKAKGVFFGITDKTTKQDMAYAVLEGVVFSLYHISEQLPMSENAPIITGGGSTADRLMMKLKAELFNREIVHVKENDSSALGAAMLAMVGTGEFSSLEAAIASVVKRDITYAPKGDIREKLLKRYQIYKNLYVSLKGQFEAFSEI